MPEGRLEFDNDIPLTSEVEMVSPSLELVDFPYVGFTIKKLSGAGAITNWCVDGSPSKHDDSYKEIADLDLPVPPQGALIASSGKVSNIVDVGDYENYIINSTGMYQLRIRAKSLGDMVVNVSGNATPHA